MSDVEPTAIYGDPIIVGERYETRDGRVATVVKIRESWPEVTTDLGDCNCYGYSVDGLPGDLMRRAEQ